MMKLEDSLVDHDDRPKYPPKIIGTEVLFNPFPDIEPRVVPKKKVRRLPNLFKRIKISISKTFYFYMA